MEQFTAASLRCDSKPFHSPGPHLRDADLPYSWFQQSLKTFLFGQLGHGAVWTILTAPSRNNLTYLLTGTQLRGSFEHDSHTYRDTDTDTHTEMETERQIQRQILTRISRRLEHCDDNIQHQIILHMNNSYTGNNQRWWWQVKDNDM